MLEREFEYYVAHQDELVSKYRGKYLYIKNKQVVNTYDSLDDAYRAAVKAGDLGKVLLHECQPGEENYTVTIYSSHVKF